MSPTGAATSVIRHISDIRLAGPQGFQIASALSTESRSISWITQRTLASWRKNELYLGRMLCHGLGSATLGVNNGMRRRRFTVADLISHTSNRVDELAVETGIHFFPQIVDINRH